MSSQYTGPEARRHVAEVFRVNWLWLVLLGAVLLVAGALAIIVPALFAIPANKVLGSVLIISGGLQTMQAAKVLHWPGFIWHLMLGLLAAVGGALIYLDPFPGIVTITSLIAILFAFHGATQIAFAWKVQHQTGWHWLVVSGCVALVVSVLLVMKLPYGHSFTPATLAGVSLGFAGWAYVAMARASRRSEGRS